MLRQCTSSKSISTLGSTTLGVVVVMVVVCLLWIYFRGKDIINTNHNHSFTPSARLLRVRITTLRAVVILMWHNYRASRPRSGDKVEEATTLKLQFKTNKDNNQFDFFLSPRPKPMMNCDLKNPPHHRPQEFTQDKC